MKKEIAIEVKNLSKHFRLPTEKSSSIKQTFINWTKGVKGYKEQRVLRNISFKIEKGDFFGIVGRNGSGKSTLLKLISDIYEPNSGSIKVNGSLISFIELGVGFNPELTGRDNIYLNGALMGFDVKEIDAMYQEIVEFAELGDFMDQKLKNYSSGMQVRLAFACAIRGKSDILVLDEILAVGDEAFQRKCNDYFDEIRKDKGKTVVLVTHNMEAVKKYCNKAIMIREGKVVAEGSPEDVANEYSLENLNETSSLNLEKDEDNQAEDSPVENFKVELLNPKKISQDDEVAIRLSYNVSKKIKTRIGVSLYDTNRNAPIFGSVSRIIDKTKVSMTLSTKLSQINDTTIRIDVTVRDDKNDFIFYLPDSQAPLFILRRNDYSKTNKRTYALLHGDGKWSDNG